MWIACIQWFDTHTLTSTQLQARCAKRQLSYYRIWNQIFSLKVPEEGGVNQSTRQGIQSTTLKLLWSLPTSVVSVVSFLFLFLLLHVDTIVVHILGSASLAICAHLSLTLPRKCAGLGVIGHQNRSRITVIRMVGLRFSLSGIICKQQNSLTAKQFRKPLVKTTLIICIRRWSGPMVLTLKFIID